VIGRIQRVNLRSLWRHEALDFTAWLEANLDVLNEATGLSLGDVGRERPVGSFSVDLVADDKEGVVVIENQLEKSDHDHLGKLLTYLVGLQAKKAVWIVSDPRPEHIAVISWLNESSSADFYLLKLEAIQIGDSPPAPLFTKIAEPSQEIDDWGMAKKDMAERYGLRLRFFEGLLSVANSKTSLHANISPSTSSYISAGSGIGGVSFVYAIRQRDARIELYIDTQDREVNQRIFESLHSNKRYIESSFGSPLEWDSKEERRSKLIRKNYGIGGYRDESTWKQTFEALSEGMANLESAIKPHLKRG
jgi:hypothetical protein